MRSSQPRGGAGHGRISHGVQRPQARFPASGGMRSRARRAPRPRGRRTRAKGRSPALAYFVGACWLASSVRSSRQAPKRPARVLGAWAGATARTPSPTHPPAQGPTPQTPTAQTPTTPTAPTPTCPKLPTAQDPTPQSPQPPPTTPKPNNPPLYRWPTWCSTATSPAAPSWRCSPTRSCATARCQSGRRWVSCSFGSRAGAGWGLVRALDLAMATNPQPPRASPPQACHPRKRQQPPGLPEKPASPPNQGTTQPRKPSPSTLQYACHPPPTPQPCAPPPPPKERGGRRRGPPPRHPPHGRAADRAGGPVGGAPRAEPRARGGGGLQEQGGAGQADRAAGRQGGGEGGSGLLGGGRLGRFWGCQGPRRGEEKRGLRAVSGVSKVALLVQLCGAAKRVVSALAHGHPSPNLPSTPADLVYNSNTNLQTSPPTTDLHPRGAGLPQVNGAQRDAPQPAPRLC